MRTPKTTERVVITGMGIVCPLGNDVATFWEALLAGRSGANRTTIFNASTFPTTFGAEVKGYNFRPYVRHPQWHDESSRGPAFAIGAAAQACRQAAVDIESPAPADGLDRTGMGIYRGAGEGALPDTFCACIIAGWDLQQQQMHW